MNGLDEKRKDETPATIDAIEKRQDVVTHKRGFSERKVREDSAIQHSALSS
jgi:hypothetical protein